MPTNIQLPYTRYLDPAGVPIGSLPAWAADLPLLVKLYRQMQLSRLFD